tara:strand:- start:7807 stop:8076 length:270 start_codon:yes stop_codon:yes gene_type:complete
MRVYNNVFFATVGWDGYDENSDGDITFYRGSLDDLLEGVEEYFVKFKERSPYLECASSEVRDSKNTQYQSQDITESVQTILNKRDKNGK